MPIETLPPEGRDLKVESAPNRTTSSPCAAASWSLRGGVSRRAQATGPGNARSAVHRKADRRAVHAGGGRLAGSCPLHRATCGARLAWQARSVKVVFSAELWLWDARWTETWTFVSLPASESEEIRDLAGGLRRGFGSVRVRATIGNSTWTTSIFPASQAGYVLPVKRPVRVAESLDVGDMVTVTVELIDFA